MGADSQGGRSHCPRHCRARLPLVATVVLAVMACGAPGRDLLVSLESIPSSDRASWEAYLDESERQRALMADALSAELDAAGLKEPVPVRSGRGFSFDRRKAGDWYRSAGARDLFLAVVSYQTPAGGWPKNIDMSIGPRVTGGAFGSSENHRGTFDNGATVSELRFLARYHQTSGDDSARVAFSRGLAFILRAQFPNGGWPQVYPLVGDYHDCVTLNDGAMTGVLSLLRDIARDRTNFGFLPATDVAAASAALEAGVECLLKIQVVAGGVPTGWAQQYDPVTLEPQGGRAYEMVSIASAETAQVVELLLSLNDPAGRLGAAIESSVAWLQSVALEGLTFSRENGDCRLIADPGAGLLWARFHEIGTNRPLFGDRDGSIHYDVMGISRERRCGYGWFVKGPQKALERAAEWNRRSEP